jgi:hypothetical protein
MSIEKFKPIVWAEQFDKDLEKSLVFYEDCNHQYEGLATKPGDSIKILGLGRPTTRTFTDGKLHALDEPEAIQGTSMTIPLNQVTDFNFYVDDLDKAQAQGGSGLLSQYMTEAKNVVAEAQDKYIAGLVADSNVATIDSVKVTTDNVLDIIDKAFLILLKNDVKRTDSVTMTVTPEFAMVLKRAYVDLDTNNSEMLANGKIGRYSNIVIKESNQVYNDGKNDIIQLKTNKAISFVKPYIHLEAYRPEGYFEDAVKGYALYDGAVTRPKEIVGIKVTY